MSFHEQAVVVLTHNSMSVLPSCLGALEASNGDWDIVVTDNNSADGVDEYVYGHHPDATFIQTGDNLGYSGGNNFALSKLGRYGQVALVNPDVLVTPACLNIMSEDMYEDTGIGVVTPKVTLANTRVIDNLGGTMDWENGSPIYYGRGETDVGQYADKSRVELAVGACMLLNMECVEDTGGFDERYFLYWEDSDFSKRAASEGYDIICDPAAHAIHAKGNSTDKSSSALRTYYYNRNALLFFQEHGDEPDLLALCDKYIKKSLGYIVCKKGEQQVSELCGVAQALLDFQRQRFGRYQDTGSDEQMLAFSLIAADLGRD